MPIRGIRGATTVPADEQDLILEATRELLEAAARRPRAGALEHRNTPGRDHPRLFAGRGQVETRSGLGAVKSMCRWLSAPKASIETTK